MAHKFLNSYVAYKFVQLLTKPFDEWEAYKLGLIDAQRRDDQAPNRV